MSNLPEHVLRPSTYYYNVPLDLEHPLHADPEKNMILLRGYVRAMCLSLDLDQAFRRQILFRGTHLSSIASARIIRGVLRNHSFLVRTSSSVLITSLISLLQHTMRDITAADGHSFPYGLKHSISLIFHAAASEANDPSLLIDHLAPEADCIQYSHLVRPYFPLQKII
jgi:hypothetical protein